MKAEFMKTTRMLVAAMMSGVALAVANAADFNAGSNGSLGDVVIDADTTVPLPPDGILHYKSLLVNSDKTLRFQRNSLNTPVILLSQGDVVINGTISVSGSQAPNAQSGGAPTGGAGGPGGFDGGKPGFSGVPPGDGYGPGAGRGGRNDFSADGAGAGCFANGPNWGESRNNHGTNFYGNAILIPLIGGSGGGGSSGGPGFGGGGGGGAILIGSNTRIRVNGSVLARGGSNLGSSVNAGSGGAIRLLAPAVAGAGLIDVRGNNGDSSAAEGWIRIDTIDRSDLRLNVIPRENHTVGANMFTFPPQVPRLDIVQAAGTDIPLNAPNPVRIQLGFGENPNKVVRVRAQNFGLRVPIAVVLTPENGSRIIIDKIGTNDLVIDNTAANPATLDVPVTIPQNVLVTINVWTR